MEKSFSIFENRRQTIEDKLELLLELDQILYHPDGAPYVLERHEQMKYQISAAREEIAFLVEQEKLIETKRRQRLVTGAGASRRKIAEKGGR